MAIQNIVGRPRGILKKSDSAYIKHPAVGELLDIEIAVSGKVYSALFRPKGATPVIVKKFEFVSEAGDTVAADPSFGAV